MTDAHPAIEPEQFPFERVSITGGTGTVGSQFLKVLLAQFPHLERINTTCRPCSPRARRMPDAPRLNVVKGSINDLDVLRAMADGGQVVYHLAAWLANTAMPDMTTVYVTNSLSAGVLARLCARRGRRLVFTSSHSVYFAGPYRGRIEQDGYPFREDFVRWIGDVSGQYYELMDAIIEDATDFDAAPGAIRQIHDAHPPPFEPKIYDRDEYHLYCLTKLLAERFVLDQGGVVLRLSNVYGPGDESTQAVGEVCQRLLAAEPGDRLEVRQPFKKLVPNYLGDIIKACVRAGGLDLPEGVPPLFTVASQEGYLREDALLRAAAEALNRIRGTDHDCDIERLPPEEETAFTYDLSKVRRLLLYGEELTPFEDGIAEQLKWLIARSEGREPPGPALTIRFAGD
ncbi:MAG: NAD-dependent epimerase/dehydratase family protein [Candidatus Brocadiia bacterium]